MLTGWSRVTIAERAADVFTPAKKPRSGLLFLHGLGLETLADNPVYTNLLLQHSFACVCPHGGASWWLDRAENAQISPEQYLLQAIVPYFRETWNLAPPNLGVFGISMGGQGALRLAFRHPKIFPTAAGISSALDFHELHGQGFVLDALYDSKEQARQDTALMHVPPYDPPPHVFFCIDPEDAAWYRGNDRLHEKLGALGVAHTIDFTTTAGGHGWEYFNRMAEPTLKFLADGLHKESRRLL